MLELLLGQIPEAIYFALFMIYTKNLRYKRTAFIILMTLEYVLLLRTMPYSIYAHIGFFVVTYIILKIIYKERAQIIDMFTLAIGNIFLIVTSIICFIMSGNNVIVATIINRIILFAFVLGFNYKLKAIQDLYKKVWNRNSNKTRMKSTTFRSINVVIFNILFYIINIGMLFAIYYNSK